VIGGLLKTALGLWGGVLLLPWQPWRNREVLEPEPDLPPLRHPDLTVLIPARDEAAVIGRTLAALARQAEGLRVVVIDDQSEDGTAEVARQVSGLKLKILKTPPLPLGWSGKLWALEQGLRQVATAWVLLLDADIELRPGMVAALWRKKEGLDLISIMARLPTETLWERLLIPPFVYFFKLLYPFRLANDPRFPRVAAAAGGCILVKRRALLEVGAFQSLRDALIDDCELAARVKRKGFRTWIGLSHGVVSQRSYGTLSSLWQMVARTAYTQLRYSPFLLLLCTTVMGVMFGVPLFGLLQNPPLAAATIGLMAASYLPTLAFYRLSPLWSLTLPLAGLLYLAMTWHSALRHLRGVKSVWKGRVYR